MCVIGTLCELCSVNVCCSHLEFTHAFTPFVALEITRVNEPISMMNESNTSLNVTVTSMRVEMNEILKSFARVTKLCARDN